jgi:polysaccharide chain length determinant protein (PEP-CTERM system associated)
MDQLIQQALETARAMWQRRWIGIAVAWVAAIAGAAALMNISDRYEASARVYVDTKSVLRPLLRDLTVEPDLDQTVGLLARTLITRPNVELLIKKANLAPADMAQADRDRLIDTLTREIKLAGVGRDNVFSFSYRDTTPERARNVVERLVTLFLELDTSNKRVDAEAARTFIDDQIKSYEERLAEAEDRLKAFKLRNLGVSDGSGKDYFARMTALTDDMAKLNVDLRAAEQARDALRRELGGETASLVPDVPPSAAVMHVPEFDARLDAQRKQLDELLRRFTDQHPDVVATKHLIARLEEERQREIEAQRKAAESKPARAAPSGNPMQQQIRLALAEAEANVASLRVKASDMQGRLAALRASASRVPQVEAEMARLNRDYEVIRGAYQTMVSRREKASLSEDVDATRAAQFRVIDPPRAAPQPVFPNRLALAPLVLLLALLAGFAATFVAVQIAPTIDNSRMLRRAAGRPVLGSIAMVPNDGLLRRARLEAVGFGSALGALLVGSAIWMAWVVSQARF